jgi:hypothetical protein
MQISINVKRVLKKSDFQDIFVVFLSKTTIYSSKMRVFYQKACFSTPSKTQLTTKIVYYWIIEKIDLGDLTVAEVYKASFLLRDISPESCYLKAMEITPKVMPDFVLWKKRPIARLFGMQKKDDEFSTINFFLVTKADGVEIEVRFNTKKYSIEKVKSFFIAFQNEMLKSKPTEEIS